MIGTKNFVYLFNYRLFKILYNYEKADIYDLFSNCAGIHELF